MRQVLCAGLGAAFLGACASTPAQLAMVSPPTPQADFSAWSCRQLAAEIELTRKAYWRAAGAQRPPVAGEPMASLYAPIAYTRAAPSAAPKMRARLEELERASRAKRCASSGPKSATA
ncbi:MAG: hypothetical protein ACK41C_04090 [Phenylobacterium sp.]|jgi:hypothetical protein|uniref:hypothetical protein n=1 Tax=Phenylobacterium sp. TaxID=1871053 RepID=UPI00391A3448